MVLPFLHPAHFWPSPSACECGWISDRGTCATTACACAYFTSKLRFVPIRLVGAYSSRWRELICTCAFLVIVCVLFCFTTVRILDNTVHYNTSSTTVYNNNQLLSNSTRISFHLFHPRFITRVTINEWFPLRETEGR